MVWKRGRLRYLFAAFNSVLNLQLLLYRGNKERKHLRTEVEITQPPYNNREYCSRFPKEKHEEFPSRITAVLILSYEPEEERGVEIVKTSGGVNATSFGIKFRTWDSGHGNPEDPALVLIFGE